MVSTLGLRLIMLAAPLLFRLSAHLMEKILYFNNMTASSASMRILENTVTIIKTTNLRWSSRSVTITHTSTKVISDVRTITHLPNY
jgi:hypothetical protein